MKSAIIILSLTLSVVGGTMGCSSRTVSGTQPLNHAPANSFGDHEVIEALGVNFVIDEQADSWAALVEQAKPTFTWNGQNMMWIGTDPHGRPSFRLNEAGHFRPIGQPLRWVLLRQSTNTFDPQSGLPQFYWMCRRLHSAPTWCESIPEMDGLGLRADFALENARHSKFGVVYEIGWQRYMCNGTAHPILSSRIYVLQDTSDRWHFLGEGPAEGSARGCYTRLESWVEWQDARHPYLPLQIKFRCVSSSGPPPTEDASPPWQDATNHYVLSGPFPAKYREVK